MNIRRHGTIIATVALAGGLALTGCSSGTTTVTTTVTATQTVEKPSVATTTTTTSTARSSPSAVPAAKPIDRLDIVTTDLGGGKVGPNRFQLRTVYDWNTPFVNIVYGWSAFRGTDPVSGHDCTVVGTITGPNGYSNTFRSDACSRGTGGATGQNIKLETVGRYTIKVSVTPSDGPEFVGTTTVEVIAKGH